MFRIFLAVAFTSTCHVSAAAEPDIKAAIETIASVEPGGTDPSTVTAALRVVESAGSSALLPIVERIGDNNPHADNWLRGAFETLAAESVGDAEPGLIEFYAKTDNNGRARRLVFETLAKSNPDLKAELLSKALDDPSEEMRYDAVSFFLRDLDKLESDEQKRSLLTEALAAATVRSQVDDIASQLEDVGTTIDKQRHFGFVKSWHLVGPFDNKGMAGFDVAYGPEANDVSAPDLLAEFDAGDFDGVDDKVRWTPVSTDADDGIVNIAETLAPHKGAIVYATATVPSSSEKTVELRLSTANAWKMWLNGELLFEREEYHRGLHWDQYRVPATLRDGENVIVIKVLQNEQDQSWAQRWSYSLRITDPTGRAIDSQ